MEVITDLATLETAEGRDGSANQADVCPVVDTQQQMAREVCR